MRCCIVLLLALCATARAARRRIESAGDFLSNIGDFNSGGDGGFGFEQGINREDIDLDTLQEFRANVSDAKSELGQLNLTIPKPPPLPSRCTGTILTNCCLQTTIKIYYKTIKEPLVQPYNANYTFPGQLCNYTRTKPIVIKRQCQPWELEKCPNRNCPDCDPNLNILQNVTTTFRAELVPNQWYPLAVWEFEKSEFCSCAPKNTTTVLVAPPTAAENAAARAAAVFG